MLGAPMLEVRVPAVAPEAEGARRSPDKGHMVFRVEVRCDGRRHTVWRRYSEFHALHKRGPIPGWAPRAGGLRRHRQRRHLPPQIKKRCKVPDFPSKSKRLANWRSRGAEQRRQGLEAYVQGVLYLNQEVPRELLEFLSLRHTASDPKGCGWGSQLQHRPVLSFCGDPYLSPPSPEGLPSVVVTGVLQGLYSFGCAAAAPAHPGLQPDSTVRSRLPASAREPPEESPSRPGAALPVLKGGTASG